ncbi:membrane protein [Thiosulfatimonas sediminis]|uniref:Membrane protein n=1 Tax=Thiosulfatimonas sediminis TaxID=2675054 RepID=A0A6F8PUW2_9GAMM|nr:PDC sensor domain-containing protein [Thiosulfatimonas sediminis]BBP45804.1 membrane protein [Thiosulfatimonas sediminis]
MQEYIHIYDSHKLEIEKFLVETIHNNGHHLATDFEQLKNFYGILPSLELIYVTDGNFVQISPNITRRRQMQSAIGRDRRYLVDRVHEADSDISISDPYISSATGEPCITLMQYYEGHVIFLDFNLLTLLTRFGFLERHPIFNRVTYGFYLAMGISLMFFSMMSIGYAFYDYIKQLLNPADYTLEAVFKPIIALTMGLAIFDLAKTLMEREVFFKAYADKLDDAKLLSKFLTAIIIALSIEALMVVFKIALHDTSQMVNALYLIIGVTLIILSLTYYSKSLLASQQAAKKCKDAE